MQKFRPIQTLASSKRLIFNHPKTLRFSERISNTQMPKTKSTRNLRSSSPPLAFGTFIDLNQKPNSASAKPKYAVSRSIHPKFKQKAEGKALKTFKRLTTLNNENIYEKDVQTLKQYINSLTFRQESSKKQCQRGRKQLNDAALCQQRKQFLMGQVSFTHIDEQRLYAQKKYLERFQYLSKSVPRNIRQSILQNKSSGGNQYKIFQCLLCIDRIYALLREMQEVGYPLKTNKFVIKYCSSGKLWLKNVFLHESDEKRDAFTIAVKYLVNHNPQDTKSCFSEFAVKIRGEELKVVQDELEGLYLHLQHSIAQKKANQVSSVADYIEGRLKQEGKNLSQSLRLTYAPPDTMKLTDDLERIEQKFGALRNITKISRKRYDQLNRTQLKLQALL